MDTVFDYERHDMAVVARREINAKRSFVVRLAGAALDDLRDLSPDGSRPDPGAMALRPKLQVLLGIWMLGEARGTVDFDVAMGMLRFRPEGGSSDRHLD